MFFDDDPKLSSEKEEFSPLSVLSLPCIARSHCPLQQGDDEEELSRSMARLQKSLRKPCNPVRWHPLHFPLVQENRPLQSYFILFLPWKFGGERPGTRYALASRPSTSRGRQSEASQECISTMQARSLDIINAVHFSLALLIPGILSRYGSWWRWSPSQTKHR